MHDPAQTALPESTSTAVAAPALDAGERWARAAASTVFFAAVVYTFYAASRMRGGMAMPGGWTMPMMWMVMPGQSLAAAAAMFLIMWQAMMVAMMLPSSWPMLELYGRVARHLGRRWPLLETLVVASGYFAVWAGFGIIAFAMGAGISSTAMVSV